MLKKYFQLLTILMIVGLLFTGAAAATITYDVNDEPLTQAEKAKKQLDMKTSRFNLKSQIVAFDKDYQTTLEKVESSQARYFACFTEENVEVKAKWVEPRPGSFKGHPITKQWWGALFEVTIKGKDDGSISTIENRA